VVEVGGAQEFPVQPSGRRMKCSLLAPSTYNCPLPTAGLVLHRPATCLLHSFGSVWNSKSRSGIPEGGMSDAGPTDIPITPSQLFIPYSTFQMHKQDAKLAHTPPVAESPWQTFIHMLFKLVLHTMGLTVFIQLFW
jgi:hypothetical protein